MISNQCGCDVLESQYGPRARSKPGRQVLDYLKKIDRTWLLIGLIFLAIAVGLPSHLLKSIWFTANNLWSIAPFLLLSATVAGYLEAAGADDRPAGGGEVGARHARAEPQVGAQAIRDLQVIGYIKTCPSKNRIGFVFQRTALTEHRIGHTIDGVRDKWNPRNRERGGWNKGR